MFAKILHRQKEDRVQIFGSLNFFAMREAIQKRKVVPVLHGNKKVNILFAGSTSKYYPTESEFKCLDFLLQAIETGDLANVTITYRPVVKDAATQDAILRRYSNTNNLKVQFADPRVFGLCEYMDSDWESIQSSHIEQLSGYDLLVMVLRSSLALDMAVLNTPAISFFGDPSGVLARRKHT